MHDIGLRIQDIKDGDKVYYYLWISDNGNHSEPIEKTIKGSAFQNQNGICVFLNDYSGYVLTSHLSKQYFPEKYVKAKKSSIKYNDYLHSEYPDSFSDYLGIIRPKFEYNRDGLVRMVSVKFNHVKSDYFRFKKDAKSNYKLKLKNYKKTHENP